MKIAELTDLELIDEFIASPFISPVMLGEVTRRGLYNVVNLLPSENRRAVARLRYKELKGGYIGDEEIEAVASNIDRLIDLRKEFNDIDITDSKAIDDHIESMKVLNQKIKNYF